MRGERSALGGVREEEATVARAFLAAAMAAVVSRRAAAVAAVVPFFVCNQRDDAVDEWARARDARRLPKRRRYFKRSARAHFFFLHS